MAKFKIDSSGDKTYLFNYSSLTPTNNSRIEIGPDEVNLEVFGAEQPGYVRVKNDEMGNSFIEMNATELSFANLKTKKTSEGYEIRVDDEAPMIIDANMHAKKNFLVSDNFWIGGGYFVQQNAFNVDDFLSFGLYSFKAEVAYGGDLRRVSFVFSVEESPSSLYSFEVYTGHFTESRIFRIYYKYGVGFTFDGCTVLNSNITQILSYSESFPAI